MAKTAAERTPEEIERKRQLQMACQRRYFQSHREEIRKKKNESYSPEKRRAEYLKYQEQELARTRARRARLRAEAAVDHERRENQEAKLCTEPPSTSSGGTVHILTS